MINWELHIEGQVQGVGFRPTVYRLARQFGLIGNVSNGTEGVRINFVAEAELAEQFQSAVLSNTPPAATVTNWRMSVQDEQQIFSTFSIIESDDAGQPNLLIPADLGLCEDCRGELFDSHNHRHHYAYTSCTNCGPRYSIINGLPYDRPRTTMAVFELCANCKFEYENPNDRRHHSQTNSCPDCAINLSLFDPLTSQKGEPKRQVVWNLIEAAVGGIELGEIVAIKGIGGYLLCCAADNDDTIQELREWKQRPHKPLALMYPNLEHTQKDFRISEAEKEGLTSAQAPIVLLRPKPDEVNGLSTKIAPGLDKIGVMLPYTPLFQLLLANYGRPIVATSGNRSGQPIAYTNKNATEKLKSIASLILADDRDLLIPQDDSVVVYTSGNRRIMLRRSRGFAPTYFNGPLRFGGTAGFATGADLKGAFGLQRGNKTYLSQNLGDLSSFDCEQQYHHCLEHLQRLTVMQPSEVIVDLHPAYVSRRIAERIASDKNLPLHRIQHHEAHFAALIGESNLIEEREKLLGVIWDGTGWGTDDQLWGGEFLSYSNLKFQRITSLDYAPVLAGDKMAREPRLSALSLCRDVKDAAHYLAGKFSDVEWAFYQKALTNPALQTSSMGRLFDAVACLLGLADRQSYEGMAASRLEVLARKHEPVEEPLLPYPFKLTAENRINTQTILAGIIEDLRQQRAVSEIAFRFHITLVELIRWVATKNNINALAFSGGVFQNSLLVELIEQRLKHEYQLYFHHQLSPNDENIAFGQLVHREISRRKEAKHKSNSYVLSNSGHG